MPAKVDGETYYRTAEVCRLAGISKNTLFRWLREGSFTDTAIRDRRGWRLFTREDVQRLKLEVNRIQITE